MQNPEQHEPAYHEAASAPVERAVVETDPRNTESYELVETASSEIPSVIQNRQKLNFILASIEIEGTDAPSHDDVDPAHWDLFLTMRAQREQAVASLRDTQILRSAMYKIPPFPGANRKQKEVAELWKYKLQELGYNLFLEKDEHYAHVHEELKRFYHKTGLFVTALRGADNTYYILCKGTDKDGKDASIIADFESGGPAAESLACAPLNFLFEAIGNHRHANKSREGTLKLHFIGHSLGCSVALITAQQWAHHIEVRGLKSQIALTLYQSAPVSQDVIDDLDEIANRADIDLSIINFKATGDPIGKLENGDPGSMKYARYTEAILSTTHLTGHTALPFEYVPTDDLPGPQYYEPTVLRDNTEFLCAPQGMVLRLPEEKPQPSVVLARFMQILFKGVNLTAHYASKLPLTPGQITKIVISPTRIIPIAANAAARSIPEQFALTAQVAGAAVDLAASVTGESRSTSPDTLGI